MKYFLFLCIITIITSCNSNSFINGSGYIIKGLNEYKLDLQLLHEEDELQLIACSMVYNEDLDATNFSQIIAINLSTADTINIIVPIRTISSTEVDADDFYFKAWDKEFHADIAHQDAYSKRIFSRPDSSDIDFAQSKIDSMQYFLSKFNGLFVYIDEKMADQFNNTYPTTIGYLILK